MAIIVNIQKSTETLYRYKYATKMLYENFNNHLKNAYFLRLGIGLKIHEVLSWWIKPHYLT